MLSIDHLIFLNNFDSYCSQITESNQTIEITQEGKNSIVIMSIEQYNALTSSEYYEASALSKALDDERNGKIRPGGSVMKEIKSKHNL